MRHDDRRRFLGLTWIGWTSLLFLQWFGIRLCAVTEGPDDVHLRYGFVWGWWPLQGWALRYKLLSLAWILGLATLNWVLR